MDDKPGQLQTDDALTANLGYRIGAGHRLCLYEHVEKCGSLQRFTVKRGTEQFVAVAADLWLASVTRCEWLARAVRIQG